MAFRYNELLDHDETIRLLQIAPSTNLDSSVPLECSILKIRLELAPIYTALSYTWGNDVATASLSIDGLSFMIRPNLHSALLALRYISSKRILWVDAICIYSDRSRIKHCRNLRFGPLFSEGFGFAYLVGPT